MFTTQEQKTINKAIAIIESKMITGEAFTSPEAAKSFCRLQLGALEQEKFAALFLTSQHALIKFEVLSIGTIDAASVYPREVVKSALKHNAAAVIFTHNHPSGLTEPSLADKRITTRLIEALSLIDIRVLDHVIVSSAATYSFAENGLL